MPKVEDKKANEKIIDAAIDLFYFQGFNGTTVRQIAQKANVNLALISYHFGGKKGLLEQLMIRFYEGYFQSIKKPTAEIEPYETAKDYLIQALTSAYTYLFDHYRMTRFIYRELTVDSTLVREVMTLYLGQEKYLYMSILEKAYQEGEHVIEDLEIYVLQLLNVLYMPFLQPQVIREVYYIEPHSEEFKQRYLSQLENWITSNFL